MQVTDYGNMRKRVVYYASKLIASELISGEDYSKLKDVVIISILNFNIFDHDKYITESVIVDKEYRYYEILNMPKFYFIELPKFRKSKINEKNITDQWLSFIDGENSEGVNLALKNNNVIKKANEEYEYLTGTARIKRLAELREKALKDKASFENYVRNTALKEGHEQGMKQGIEQEKLIIARSLLKNGISIEIISKSTGLSVEELNKLK